MLVILGMVQVLAALTVLRSFAVFVWLANFVYTLVVISFFKFITSSYQVPALDM